MHVSFIIEAFHIHLFFSFFFSSSRNYRLFYRFATVYTNTQNSKKDEKKKELFGRYEQRS